MNYNFIPFSTIVTKFNLHLRACKEKKNKCKWTALQNTEDRCGTVLSQQ